MDEFFTFASPLTLVSLIVDIDQSDMPNAPLTLRQKCVECLTAIVGEQEAIDMIEECEMNR